MNSVLRYLIYTDEDASWQGGVGEVGVFLNEDCRTSKHKYQYAGTTHVRVDRIRGLNSDIVMGLKEWSERGIEWSERGVESSASPGQDSIGQGGAYFCIKDLLCV